MWLVRIDRIVARTFRRSNTNSLSPSDSYLSLALSLSRAITITISHCHCHPRTAISLSLSLSLSHSRAIITMMKPLNHRYELRSLQHAFVVVLMVISVGISSVMWPLEGVDALRTRKVSILPRDDLDLGATAAPCKCGYEPMNGVPGNTCVACAAGSYSSGTKCLPCLAGTIAPSSGSCSCQPCGAGTQSSPNATSCEPCPVGTYSNDNNPCKQCPDGSISTTAGATSCKQCSTLLSQSCGVGSTQGVSCRLCPIGTYGPSATSGCINCPAVRSRAASESRHLHHRYHRHYIIGHTHTL